jgi:hypothetical protein
MEIEEERKCELLDELRDILHQRKFEARESSGRSRLEDVVSCVRAYTAEQRSLREARKREKLSQENGGGVANDGAGADETDFVVMPSALCFDGGLDIMAQAQNVLNIFAAGGGAGDTTAKSAATAPSHAVSTVRKGNSQSGAARKEKTRSLKIDEIASL